MRPQENILQDAISLAEAWQKRADAVMTRKENKIQEQMQKMLTHPTDKIVMTKMIDQSFRSHDHKRVAHQLNHVLEKYGVPEFFSRQNKCSCSCISKWDAIFRISRFPKSWSAFGRTARVR
ncbi:MAG: hypothetical protein U5R06_15265 [candidate division KSB1 bacterium]|nr:hypothetical protein [candidate division KSB1 bacterium]